MQIGVYETNRFDVQRVSRFLFDKTKLEKKAPTAKSDFNTNKTGPSYRY